MVHTLIEAFRYRGCPICQILDQDEYDFMCQWQHRTFMEEKTREDLVSAKGYCNFHFYEMARLTSPLVNAVVVKELETHIEKGLGQGDAGARLEKYGPNELKERPRPGFLRMLLDQFK